MLQIYSYVLCLDESGPWNADSVNMATSQSVVSFDKRKQNNFCMIMKKSLTRRSLGENSYFDQFSYIILKHMTQNLQPD